MLWLGAKQGWRGQTQLIHPERRQDYQFRWYVNTALSAISEGNDWRNIVIYNWVDDGTYTSVIYDPRMDLEEKI